MTWSALFMGILVYVRDGVYVASCAAVRVARCRYVGFVAHEHLL